MTSEGRWWDGRRQDGRRLRWPPPRLGPPRLAALLGTSLRARVVLCRCGAPTTLLRGPGPWGASLSQTEGGRRWRRRPHCYVTTQLSQLYKRKLWRRIQSTLPLRSAAVLGSDGAESSDHTIRAISAISAPISRRISAPISSRSPRSSPPSVWWAVVLLGNDLGHRIRRMA